MSLSTLYLRLRHRRHTFGLGFEGPWRLRIRGRGRTALLTFGADARIEIGDRVEIDGAGLMSASAIVVGDDAVLGPCLIVDTDFHAVGPARREGGAPVTRRPIRIGPNAWVQGKATVLKGVSVGEGAVVRWGALVAGDVPPGTVVMGNPAVEVRER